MWVKLKLMQHRFSSNDMKYDQQSDVVFSSLLLMTPKTSSYIWVVRFMFWIIPYILHWIVWPLRFVAFLDLDNRGNYQEKSTKMYHTGLTCFNFSFFLFANCMIGLFFDTDACLNCMIGLSSVLSGPDPVKFRLLGQNIARWGPDLVF